MKRFLSAVLGGFFVLALVSTASAKVYEITPKYSQFQIWNLFGPAQASFQSFEGKLHYKPTDIYNTSLKFKAHTESFHVQKSFVDLPGHFFIDPQKYPEITFESTSVKPHGKHLMVTGNLTLMGITREVTLPLEVLGKATHPKSSDIIKGLDARVTVKLSDTGIEKWADASGLLGNTLHIQLRMLAVADKTYASVE